MPRALHRFSCATLASPLLAMLTGVAALTAFPAIEVMLFAQGAARIAALLVGAPVVHVEAGWLLPLTGLPVVVSEACSATGFFLTIAALVAWQLASLRLPVLTSTVISLVMALPVTLIVNAVRVICLVQLHHWVVPVLPEKWAAFAHMTTGVALFLPALIGLNLLFESHARHLRTSRS